MLTFKTEASHDVDEMLKLVNDMETFLNILANKEIPDDDITASCESLIDGQRNDIKGLKKGSWAVSPDIDGMGSDARMDFIFFPTFIAIAILTLVKTDHPALTEGLYGLNSAMKKGYRNATSSLPDLPYVLISLRVERS